MVIGLEQLSRKLKREIPKKVGEAAQKSMEQSADEIVATMKNLVPVASGALRDSIGWTWGKPPEGSTVIGKGSAGDNLRITIYAGNKHTMVAGEQGRIEFQLARLIEFGTQKMTAQPFFFPAWRATRNRARSRMTRAVKKALE